MYPPDSEFKSYWISSILTDCYYRLLTQADIKEGFCTLQLYFKTENTILSSITFASKWCHKHSSQGEIQISWSVEMQHLKALSINNHNFRILPKKKLSGFCYHMYPIRMKVMLLLWILQHISNTSGNIYTHAYTYKCTHIRVCVHVRVRFCFCQPAEWLEKSFEEHPTRSVGTYPQELCRQPEPTGGR